MQSFLTSFTVSINRLRRTSGHVFQGRFKSQLVEDELYRSKLSRYIHLNPVRVSGIKNVELSEKKKYLHDYKWSSFRYYLGIEAKPKWLELSNVLSGWGTKRKEQMKNYRGYVEEGLLKDIDNPFDDISHQSLIGSDSFVDKIKREYILGRDVNNRTKTDHTALSHLQSSFTFDEIVNLVGEIYGVDPLDILKRKSVYGDYRRVLLYCLSKYCRSTMSLTDMAERCSISVSGLTRSRDKVKTMIMDDEELEIQLKSIEKLLKENIIDK